MTMLVTVIGNLIINITDVANVIRIITYLTTLFQLPMLCNV
jgi:hypothetical protein